MPGRSLLVVFFALLASACAPSVRVPILQPALVDVPSEIRVIGVIDRSGPKNAGEVVLGTLEGILTGEGIGGDREGAALAVSAMVGSLAESPRFDVVVANVDRRQIGASLFDTNLDFRTVQRVCRQVGCDALLSLEAFDSNSALTVDGNPIDPRRVYTDVTVQRDTRVMASWRLYDARQDRILDESRGWTRNRTWSNQGETLPQAIAGLPNANDSVRAVGGVMGAEYARRIAATWVVANRKFYGGGDRDLVFGKRHARASDWDGAASIWRGLLDHPRPRVSGKAHYNLALAHEVEGDLVGAIEHAKQAAVKLYNGRTRSYVFLLERRLADQARLQAQLAPPAEPAAPIPPERSTTKPPPPSTKPAPRPVPSTKPGTMTRPR